MLIVSGEEMCPRCGRVIDPTDDVVVVSPNEAVRAVPVGGYHRECLSLLLDREQVAAKWRDNIVATIRRRADSVAVVGQGRGYVIVFNSADEQVVLYYLDQMASQRFLGVDEWRDFAALVKDFNPDAGEGPREAAPQSGGSRLAVKSGGRVVVSWIEPVGLEVDLKKANYDAFVAEFGPLRGEVDFAELITSQKLSPVQIEGSLEKNRGVIRDIRAIGEVYVVSLDAPKRVEVPLTVAEFRELQRAVAGVNV
jgi:hypothetical protein